jgi:hypothetical protein
VRASTTTTTTIIRWAFYWPVGLKDYPPVLFSVVQHFFARPVGNSKFSGSVLKSPFFRRAYATCFCSLGFVHLKHVFVMASVLSHCVHGLYVCVQRHALTSGFLLFQFSSFQIYSVLRPSFGQAADMARTFNRQKNTTGHQI